MAWKYLQLSIRRPHAITPQLPYFKWPNTNLFPSFILPYFVHAGYLCLSAHSLKLEIYNSFLDSSFPYSLFHQLPVSVDSTTVIDFDTLPFISFPQQFSSDYKAYFFKKYILHSYFFCQGSELSRRCKKVILFSEICSGQAGERCAIISVQYPGKCGRGWGKRQPA